MKRLFTILALITWSALSSAQPAPVRTAARLPVTPNDGALPWNYGPYAYDPTGNVTGIGSQYFVYDPMGRLVKSSTAQTPQQQMQQEQEFAYDVYGNMTQMKNAGVTTNFTIDAPSNHLLSANVSYDAAGNVITWKPEGSPHERNYTYDALNRIVEERVAGNDDFVYHIYTADDERYWTFAYHGSEVSHLTIRDLNGKVLRDFKLAASEYSVFRDYIYRDGTLLASLSTTGDQHVSVDHLGSPRLITNASRYRVGAHTYMPFGLEWTDGTPQEGDRLKFTAHERDATFVATDVEAGRLDYMHARFYSANLGRFLSVDPVLDVKLATRNPQGWNRYSYVRNNPLRYTDPTGRQVACANNPQDCKKQEPPPPPPPAEKKGTLSVGVSVSGSVVAVSGSVNAALSVDRKGEVAGSVTGGAGPTTAAAGVSGGATVMVTNATSVNSLSGKGTAGGASGGAVVGGTVDHIRGPQGNGQYEGVAVTLGPGVKTPEGHYQFTYTWMLTGTEVKQAMANWYMRTEQAAQNWVTQSLPNLEGDP